MNKYSDPKLWDKLKGTVMKGDKGGKPNQWSARKAQLLVKMYKDAGGEFIGKKLKNNSLVRWTKQNWQTKSGLPSLLTGERYLPEKAIDALSNEQYDETSRKKREDLKLGYQFSGQPNSILELVRSYIR
jgi:hypothetical protein